MSSQSSALIFLLALSGIIILTVFYKSKHFVKAFFISALSGIGALFAVNVLSEMTGVILGINYITLAVSALGGIPGVIGLLAVRIMMLI